MVSTLETIDSSPEERADLLDKTRWAHKLEWEHVKGLAQYFQIMVCKPKDCIIEEAKPARMMGIILTGKVLVSKGASDGSDQVICELGQGKAIGEISLLDGGSASASIIAKEKTKLLVLTSFRLEELSMKDPRLALSFYKLLGKAICERLRQTSGRLVEYL